MKKSIGFFYLFFIVSICLFPYGNISSLNFGSGFLCRTGNVRIFYNSTASLPDYYIQQSYGNLSCCRSLKAEKNHSFEKNISDIVFCDIQKKIDTVFYPPYLSACSVRCISLSKFKKLTIRRQTLL